METKQILITIGSILLDIFPRFAAIDVFNSPSGNSEVGGDFVLRQSAFPKKSYFTNLLSGQLRVGRAFAAKNSLGMNTPSVTIPSGHTFRLGMTTVRVAVGIASLLVHIFVVVGLRAFEQMCAVAAWRPVALVTHVEWPRVFASKKKVSNTICPEAAPNAALNKRKYAVVASGEIVASPFPAISLWAMPQSFINLLPEAFNGLCRKSRKWFRFCISHDLSLRSRLGLWSGSFAVQPAFEPLLF